MAISISNSLPSASVGAATSLNSPAAQKAQPAPSGPEDVVQISADQQIHHLYEQGQRVSQIAFSLNLPIETVNSYLGITGTTS